MTPPPPGAALTWTDEGAPRSAVFGDIYFSPQDGLAESRAVFLDGCDLPAAWSGRSVFTAAELGFGTGLNVAALLDLWRRHRPDGRLRVFSVEAHPLSRDAAARALSAFPEARKAADALLSAWPPPTPGFHRIDLPAYGATLDLAVGDVAWALNQWSGPADAWFLDGFAPAANPAMWTPQVLAAVAARSAPGARLATFTVAGHVRRGLQDAGFQVEKKPGHGRKRERLEARLSGAAFVSPPAIPRVAVIGAGIAGAAVVRALVDLGVRPLLIEREGSGAGASGFPAALVTPRLDAGDAVIAALNAQALARAGDLYRCLPGAVTAQGVVRLAARERDAARFERIAAQPIWPPGAMQAIDASAAADRLGPAASRPAAPAALLMHDALAVAPAVILDAWLAGAERLTAEVCAVEAGPDGWRLHLVGRDAPLVVDAVVLCAGWDGQAIHDLGLSPARGQAEWVAGVGGPAVAWGGYAAPGAGGLLFGATHERGRIDTAPSPDDAAANLKRLAAVLPDVAAAIGDRPVISRAAVRAVTPDRLPLCGAVPDSPGLFVLSGLGSRGFCLAPLLGEHLAATIAGAPSPLPADAARRLAPGRFKPA